MHDHEDPEVSRVAIVFFRALRGWSQAELARAAGLSASAVSRYEQGHETPSRRTLARAAAAVGLPPHLVERCLALIRSALAALAGGAPAAEPLAGLEALAGELAAGLEELVRAAVARVLAAVPGLAPGPWSAEPPPAAEPPERGEELWQSFADCTAEERLLLVEKTTEFRSWRLSVRVCEESLRAAADDADAAAGLAALALRIAELAPGEEAWRLRLRGFALYHLGNARRVKGELREADEETFPEARRLWRDGALGDPGLLNEARVLGLEASLRKDQRQLQEALTLTEKALAVDQDSEAKHLLLNKANILKLTGDYEGALAALEQAAPLVQTDREPRLAAVLRFNWVVNLCHLERYTEAEGLLPEVRELAAGLGNELDLVRTRWLEGRVDAGLGREQEARAAFEQVRREFSARKMAYDYALASLELAVLHLEPGRTREVRALAREMGWIFRDKGVHTEALAALKLFREAAEREAATAELARRLVEYLHRAEHDPGLRFAAP